MSEYPAPEQRRLARQIARGTRETRALARGDQAAFRGVDVSDGPFKFYDEDGNVIFQIGALDDDGNYTSPDFDPTVPPTPEIPTVTSTVDGFIVDYDGTYVDDNAPDNLHRVDVHVSATPNFEKDDATLVGSFLSPDGGNVLVPFINGTTSVWVALVAVTTSGVESLPSEEVEAVGGIAFTQDDFVLTAPGAQDIKLTHLPLTNSEHLYWNGLYQPGSEWSRVSKTVTLNDPEGYLTVDDAIRVEYAYVLTPLVPVQPVVTAVGQFDIPRDTRMTSLALPAGTQIGDLIIVNAITGWNSAVAEIHDSRMTAIAGTQKGDTPTGSREWGVWVGYATSLEPLSVQMQTLYDAYGQFGRGCIAAFRGTVDTLEYDSERIAVTATRPINTGMTPALPGEGSGAIVTLSVDGNTAGTGFGTGTMAPYVYVIQDSDSLTATSIGLTTELEVPEAGPPVWSGSGNYRAVVIGLK